MKVIKPATAQDLAIIHDLAHEIWPHAYGHILSAHQLKYMLDKFYSITSLQNQLQHQHHECFIIYDNEVAIGFADCCPKQNEPSTYRLNKIYVLPTLQGTGTGKMLLNYVVNKAKSAGASFLELNVNRYNKAKSFYEKYGFTVHSEEDIDIGEGYFMNDYVMRLTLQ